MSVHTPCSPGGAIYRPDSALTAEEDRQLRRLLACCFPYQPLFRLRRHLHATPPQHRWMIVAEHGEPVAHAAVYERSILVNDSKSLPIGGVAEVCVAPAHRGRGYLKTLLSAIHDFLQQRGTPFAMLFGKPPLYRSSGYHPIANPLRSTDFFLWKPFKGTPMVRPFSSRPWPDGAIDLQGPTF